MRGHKGQHIIAFNFRLKPKLNKYSPRCDGAKCMSRNVVSVSCLNGAKRCGRVRCGAERCGVANTERSDEEARGKQQRDPKVSTHSTNESLS